MIKAGIVGGTGYTGVELLRLLVQHPQIELKAITSRKEAGTPVSAIEAMAACRPVVATRVGGLPDLITDGKTGRLVRPQNAQALADAVLELLADAPYARALGETASAHVLEHFTEARLLRDIEALYTDLLTRKNIPV